MAHLFSKVLAVSLSFLLTATSLAQGPDGAIQIRVLAGDGGINNINSNVAVEPVIEVVDSTGKPVAKATVTLRAPASGPSVTFFGASRVSTLTTDDEGRVRVTGMVPNTMEGSFQIEVEAEFNNMTAASSITQANAVAPGEPRPKRRGIGWRMIAAISAAATVGIVAAALRGDSETVTPTSIRIGSVGVTTPR